MDVDPRTLVTDWSCLVCTNTVKRIGGDYFVIYDPQYKYNVKAVHEGCRKLLNKTPNLLGVFHNENQ